MTHASSRMLLRVVAFLSLMSPPLAGCQTSGAGPAADKRPNVLFLVLDDVGFSNLGAFGSEIKTPVIDSLAKGGVKITDFHRRNV